MGVTADEPPQRAPTPPPIHTQATPAADGGDTIDLLADDGDDALELLTPPPLSSVSKTAGLLATPAADVAVIGGGGNDVDVVGGTGDGDGDRVLVAGNSNGVDDTVTASDGAEFAAAAADELFSEGGLESDDSYQDAQASVGSSTGAGSAAVEGGGALGARGSLDAVLPGRRVTTSPSSYYDGSQESRRASVEAAQAPGFLPSSSFSGRMTVGERIAAARRRAGGGGAAVATDSAPVTPRTSSFSRRFEAAVSQPATPSYRGSAKKTGIRSAADRETQFLGSQM